MNLSNLFLAGRGWEGFLATMQDFFVNGMAGSGYKGVGIAVVVIGLLGAVISFVVHKLNQQSRIPSWGMFLLVALFGSFLLIGINRMLTFLELCRDWFLGLLGV